MIVSPASRWLQVSQAAIVDASRLSAGATLTLRSLHLSPNERITAANGSLLRWACAGNAQAQYDEPWDLNEL